MERRGPRYPGPDLTTSDLLPVRDLSPRPGPAGPLGKVRGQKQGEVPWARPSSRFTLLFELLVLYLCREMSVAVVAALTSEHANRLWRILEHYVGRTRREVDLRAFHQLGIDEFSVRKGQVYMISFSNLEASQSFSWGRGAKRGSCRALSTILMSRDIDPA
jgi:hypothetical protein